MNQYLHVPEGNQTLTFGKLFAYTFTIFVGIFYPTLSIPADIAPIHDGVYCLEGQSSPKIFASKLLPNGNLSFGISIWSRAGNNIGVFGTAHRKGKYWEYNNNMDKTETTSRCKVDILFRSDGSLILDADKMATCQSMGGFGTEIGRVQFPVSAYEGRVRNELGNAETFFKTAGRCWRTRPER